MNPSVENFSGLNGGTRKTCATATEHYIKGSTGHAQNSDNNLQLVHLLTTNPAAALPAIFPGNGSNQKFYSHGRQRAFQMSRPRISSQANNSWRCGLSDHVIGNEQIKVANSWTATIMSERVPFRRERSFSELYICKEDMDKKACCIDKDGNFDFQALLPALYWKPKLQEES